MSTRNFKRNFFIVAGADAVKRIAEWIKEKYYTKSDTDDLLDDKVDKVNGKGLSTEDYTTAEKNKLSSIENGAEVNVQSDWNQTNTSADDFIKNKPSVYTKSETDNLLDDKVDKVSGKGLSTEDFTTAEKTKLGGIEAGAEVNVQSDWNQSDNTKDDFIKNKPTLRQPSSDGTSGQYLKSNGSGNAPSWETMDSAPTDNSTKAVTSGGVKTALDGKQASVTISTNANTPTDNDTVIMQDNGNTGTTSFLRRKLSTLWNYFKGKADGVYVPFAFVNLVGDGGSKNLWDNILDGKMWGADQRFNVTWVSYNIESGEVVETKDAKNLFNMADNYYKHPITGEKDIITISPKDGLSSSYLWIYCHGYYYLNFYSTKLPESATLRWKQRNSDTWNTATFETFGRGNQSWRALIPWGSPNVSTYVNTIEITIIGKTDSEVAWPGTSVCNLTHICTRETLGERGVVTKYAIAQNLYGNLTAPKFITRGGTTSQFVLGDGTLQNSPIPVSKGGTGATTAIGAEYNILNQVANMDNTSLSDDRRFAICNQTKSATNGVFRWYKLSALWNWIKTHFDSSPTSGSSNGITSGGVYSALEEKVNLQPDFTASQIDYSAGNVGKWQKVLRFPEGADLVINMKKTAMGSDSTSTLWFSSSSMGDSYTSLFGNHSVRFVHDGGYVFLVLACRKSTYEPIESYTFQIAHSSVPMSDIVAVTEASPITATPKEPSIVYRAPITTGAVSFNVNSSGAGSVAMANHNDFLGNMTSEATNGVVVTMSGATEGQIYRFVFTRNITGGVTFKQSNVAYCTISGDVNAGDTITLTAVSNTADGWLYEQESAGMTSTDGSVSIDYSSGIPDLSVETVPFNNLVNKAMFQEGDSPNPLAVGEISEALIKTNDSQYPYACTYNGKVTSLSVNGGTSALYYNVTEGTTYSVNTGGDVVTYTAVGNGCIFALYNNIYSFIDNPLWVGSGSRQWNIRNSATYYVFNPTNAYRVNTHCFIIETPSLGEEITALDTYSVVLYYMLQTIPTINTAVGYMAKAIGEYSSAIGAYSRANSYRSIALGADAIVHCRSGLSVGEYSVCAQDYGIAIGSNSNVKATTDESGIAIGHGAECSRGEGVAIGWLAKLAGRYGVAIGSQSENNGIYGVAIGYNTKVRDGESIAIGNQSKANKGISISIGKNSRSFGLKDVAIGAMSNTGDDSGDENRPNLKTYTFDGVKFTYGANEVYNVFIYNGGDVTFSLNNTSYTLTSPSSYPRMLMVVNDSNAQYLHRSLSATIECDGSLRYNGGNPQEVNANIVQLSGSYYAVWIVYNSTNPYTATSSLRLYATITSTESEDEKIAIGTYNNVYDRTSVALGSYLIPIGAGQVVLGRYNKPTAGYLVIGNGTNSTTGRKNCLTIDSNERLNVSAYVGGTQTINMSQQTGSLSNITKAVYRIRWDGTGEVTLTLNTSGCVEGQRVTIFAETNDVKLFAQPYLIRQGRFCDFMFLGGAWRPSMGIEELVS